MYIFCFNLFPICFIKPSSSKNTYKLIFILWTKNDFFFSNVFEYYKNKLFNKAYIFALYQSSRQIKPNSIIPAKLFYKAFYNYFTRIWYFLDFLLANL